MPIILPDDATGLTFLELQDAALHDDFAPAKYREFAKRYLNEALHRIYRTTRIGDADETEAIALTAGTSTYELPARSIRVDSLRDPATSQILTPVSIDDLDAYPASSGTPTMYALVGSDLQVYPTPTATGSLELRYRLNPSDMVEDDDEPILHPDYRHLLVSYARSKLFLFEDDPQMASVWGAQWTVDLAELRADLQKRGRRIRQVGSAAGPPVRPRFVRP